MTKFHDKENIQMVAMNAIASLAQNTDIRVTLVTSRATDLLFDVAKKFSLMRWF